MSYLTEQYDNWKAERLGKFTASQIHKLLTESKKKDEVFGDTAKSYINSVIAEIITGEEPEISSKEMEWGQANEMDAVLEYENLTGAKIEYYGISNPKFFPYNAMSGGSPDGIIPSGNSLKIKGITEVKCPYVSANHISNIRIKTIEDFKKKHADYYSQVQFNMLCAGADYCDFISYDPRVISHRLRLGVIRIPKDEDHQNKIIERLELAVNEVKTVIDSFVNPAYIASQDAEVNAMIVEDSQDYSKLQKI